MSKRYWLKILTGDKKGEVYPIEQNEVLVGREATNDIVINDPAISRRHVRINIWNGQIYLEDLGSTNGTYISGSPILGSQILQAGDVFGLGRELSLTIESENDQGEALSLKEKPELASDAPGVLPVQPALETSNISSLISPTLKRLYCPKCGELVIPPSEEGAVDCQQCGEHLLILREAGTVLVKLREEEEAQEDDSMTIPALRSEPQKTTGQKQVSVWGILLAFILCLVVWIIVASVSITFGFSSIPLYVALSALLFGLFYLVIHNLYPQVSSGKIVTGYLIGLGVGVLIAYFPTWVDWSVPPALMAFFVFVALVIATLFARIVIRNPF